jgi:quinol monooxygenase YgiN
MQRLTLVRYTAKPDRADENEALSRAVFDELRKSTPANISYALFRNGTEFLHLFVNTETADAAVLTELPSFKAFGKDHSTRCVAPAEPVRYEMQLLDSYGLKSSVGA